MKFKHIIVQSFEKLGYFLLRADEWRRLQQRLATTEITLRANSELKQRAAEMEEAHRAVSDQLKQRLAETEEAHRALSDQLKQQEQLRAVAADAAARSTDLEKRLGECVNARHLLTLQMGRLQARVQALKRRRDRLQTELRFSREQISRADTSGRIQELETENHRLWQRISDLEVYLQETRGSSRPYYL
jgi:chromosome segregation ATPase